MERKRVEKGEYYYSLTYLFEVKRKKDNHTARHDIRFAQGNYFVDRTDAERLETHIKRFL